ncbi:MAG: glycine/sarcosine/betaine reductase component B subunit, partial [Acidimicrobiia bacterium]|nr:glycine/sarcosine/betaine reductase component B subunit [Acidimicrobiia bacterium]
MQQSFSLNVHTIDIDDVRLGDRTQVEGHSLTIDAAEVTAMILEDDRIAEAQLDIVSPGDPVRIVHCLDAVEPRTKLAGDGVVFPGFLGGMDTVGNGDTLRLGGVSVLVSSKFPQPVSGLLQAREAVVDMSGPTASYSPFSRVINIVASLTPNPEVENEDYDDAARRAGLRMAEFLARQGGDPDTITEFDFSTRNPDLPNVVYFYQ